MSTMYGGQIIRKNEGGGKMKKIWLAALAEDRQINARRVQAICYLSLAANFLAVALLIAILVKHLF